MSLPHSIDDIVLNNQQQSLNQRTLWRRQHALKPEQRGGEERIDVAHITLRYYACQRDALMRLTQDDAHIASRLIAAHAGAELCDFDFCVRNELSDNLRELLASLLARGGDIRDDGSGRSAGNQFDPGSFCTHPARDFQGKFVIAPSPTSDTPGARS